MSKENSLKPNIGMIGLAVMGSNLARNIESRGIPVAVYNRSTQVTADFMANNQGKQFVSADSLEGFVKCMSEPRQIFIMVKAGSPTDQVIDSLVPLLSKGDIIIDGGNSYFKDTERREKRCKEAGLNFLGLGVSGGEEGALKGPSLMPGGPKDAWQILKPTLEKIAAQADGPCTAYIGPGGAGHFVKMVHNGIEYGDMQLIAEAYELLRKIAGIESIELAEIFADWNRGVLQSFLIEITAKIFKKKDAHSVKYLVDCILDQAGQKGTGKWTVQEALELGVGIPTMTAAVDARVMSSIKAERVAAAKQFAAPQVIGKLIEDRKQFIQSVHDALYCSKIMSYAQGMALLSTASKHYNWDLKLNEIAALWKGGCIIRAKFLDEIRKAYADKQAPANLILNAFMKAEVTRTIAGLRAVVILAAKAGVAIPAFSASLAYFEAYRTANLPQNLTQAQRDFFGAHTYARVDKEGVFHTQWE